jgi:hypothetical protein
VIPAFDPATGALPVGIHDATWAEVVARYGFTPRRVALLAGLRLALDLLEAARCTKVWLGGSFVTSKANPGDWDACWLHAGVDINVLHPIFAIFDNERALQKAVFGGELLPSHFEADDQGTSYLAFFQTDTYTRQAVGIISIGLGGPP